VSKFKKNPKPNAIVRRIGGDVFWPLKRAHQHVRDGLLVVLKDGSFAPVVTAPQQFSGRASCSNLAVYQEQILDAGWRRLMGPQKIRAKEAKHVPFAGDIRKLRLSA
jgi:hypothetical protein